MSERLSASKEPGQKLPMPAYPLHAQRQQAYPLPGQPLNLTPQDQGASAPVSPPKKPWYKQWWIWTIAAVALLAIVIGVVLVSKDKTEPEIAALPQSEVVEEVEPEGTGLEQEPANATFAVAFTRLGGSAFSY